MRNRLLGIILVGMLCLALSSCGNRSASIVIDKNTPSIVGKWKANIAGDTSTITFREDGTGEISEDGRKSDLLYKVDVSRKPAHLTMLFLASPSLDGLIGIYEFTDANHIRMAAGDNSADRMDTVRRPKDFSGGERSVFTLERISK